MNGKIERYVSMKAVSVSSDQMAGVKIAADPDYQFKTDQTIDSHEAESPADWDDFEDSGPETDDLFEKVSDDEWENRILCVDESCIGVIGPDGRCKECGKPYKENG